MQELKTNQELSNAISTLSGCIDPLVRAKQLEAIKKVTEKILELVAKIKV